MNTDLATIETEVTELDTLTDAAKFHDYFDEGV